MNKQIQDRCNAIYEKLVPDEGKASTVEGEMVRAICKIWYRYNNDGDYFWKGYGTETVGPAHAYLIRRSPIKEKLKKILARAVNKKDDEYEAVIEKAIEAIVEYIDGRNGKTEKNTIDMWNVSPELKNDNDEECEDDWCNMERSKQISVIQHAIRWCNNILTEVLGNYGKALSDRSRTKLQRVVQALSDCLTIGDDEK